VRGENNAAISVECNFTAAKRSSRAARKPANVRIFSISTSGRRAISEVKTNRKGGHLHGLDPNAMLTCEHSCVGCNVI
jgi:hypothetical protein